MESGAGYELLERIKEFVIDPAVKVIFTLGLFFFLYGLVQFLWKLRDGQVDQEGKKHMLWGMVGMLIMVSVYGIISLVMNTFGIDPDTAVDVGRVDNVEPGINFFRQ